MFVRKKFIATITSVGILIFSNFAFSDSSPKNIKPVENNEYNSLSAPTSDTPRDIKAKEEANNRNLSSRPPHNTTTNNKPFDGNDKNKSSGNTKPH